MGIKDIAARLDGWLNLATGLGDVTRDKRLTANVSRVRLGYEELLELYAADDMAARIVDAPAHEMVREWAEVKIQDDKESAEAIEKKFEELNAQAAFYEALRYQRAFGGAGILIGADDGQSLDKPLNEDAIKSIDYLTVLQSYELIGVAYYADPREPKFGKVQSYRLAPKILMPAATGTTPADVFSLVVHESRLLTFQGELPARQLMFEHNGWGESVLLRCVEVIRDYQSAWGGAGNLLTDFSQAVFKMKNLADILSSNGNEGLQKVMGRLTAMEMARSSLRALIIDADAGEEFERKATPLSGLPEMLQQFSLRLAAAARMPVSLLMGQPPSGLNATGESDIRWFYDQIAALQREQVVPPLKRLVELLCLSKDGPTDGQVPENWSVKMRPLWQLSEKEKADVRLAMAQADAQYLDRTVVHPEEVADSRFGGDDYSIDTQLDQEVRDAYAKALEAQQQAALQTGMSTTPGTVKPGVGQMPTTSNRPMGKTTQPADGVDKGNDGPTGIGA